MKLYQTFKIANSILCKLFQKPENGEVGGLPSSFLEISVILTQKPETKNPNQENKKENYRPILFMYADSKSYIKQ